MAETKCVECGQVYGGEPHGWYVCKDCGDIFCPECSDELAAEGRRKMAEMDQERLKEEKERMEKIANTDNLDEYKRLICPRCETDLMMYPGA